MAESDDNPDDPGDDLTDAQVASMAAAALTDIHTHRNRTHDKTAAALAAILAALAAGLDVHSLLAADEPAANRDTRRAGLAAELQRQARVLGLDNAWHGAARDAHTAAILAGAAAAAHVLSAGKISAEPRPSPFPNPFNPTGWVDAQRRGLAGDLVDYLRRQAKTAPTPPAAADLLHPVVPGAGPSLDDLGITAADLQANVAAGTGALYYLDVQVSQAYLGATTAVYRELGFVQYWWCALDDARTCPTCSDYEANSPYSRGTLPGTPHGGCRCFTMPGDTDPGKRAR